MHAIHFDFLDQVNGTQLPIVVFGSALVKMSQVKITLQFKIDLNFSATLSYYMSDSCLYVLIHMHNSAY